MLVDADDAVARSRQALCDAVNRPVGEQRACHDASRRLADPAHRGLFPALGVGRKCRAFRQCASGKGGPYFLVVLDGGRRGPQLDGSLLRATLGKLLAAAGQVEAVSLLPAE